MRHLLCTLYAIHVALLLVVYAEKSGGPLMRRQPRRAKQGKGSISSSFTEQLPGWFPFQSTPIEADTSAPTEADTSTPTEADTLAHKSYPLAAALTEADTSAHKSYPLAAFCLSGQPRSFVLPAVHLSIQRNLIDAFGAAESHVFWYFKLEHDYNKGEASGVTESDLAGAKSVMQPVSVVYDTKQEANSPVGACAANIAGQYKSIRECHKMILSEEKTRKLKYDYVFRVRPDVAWVRRFPDYKTYEEKWQGVSTMRDTFVVSGRRFADAIFAEPLHCGGLTEAGETVLAERIISSRAEARFPCIRSSSTHKCLETFDMHLGWVWSSGPEHWISEWPCFQGLWTLRLQNPGHFQGQNGKDIISLTKGTENKYQSLLNSGALRNFLSNKTLSQDLVEYWNRRPMCSGACQELAKEGKIFDNKALRDCENENFGKQSYPSLLQKAAENATALAYEVDEAALLSCIRREPDMTDSCAELLFN